MRFTIVPVGGTYHHAVCREDAAGAKSLPLIQSDWRDAHFETITGQPQRMWVAEPAA